MTAICWSWTSSSPQYQLAKHKGYGTKLHHAASIAQYGIQPFYRRSFLKKQGYWPEGK